MIQFWWVINYEGWWKFFGQGHAKEGQYDKQLGITVAEQMLRCLK